MDNSLIDIDDLPGEDRDHLEKLMLLVSPSDRADIRLRRLLLFRLRLDGFTQTRNYLVEKTRSAERCGFSSGLFEYLKDDEQEKGCGDAVSVDS